MAAKILTATVQCPKCKASIPVRLRMPSPPVKTARATCSKCGHQWTYRGALKRRVECPKCRSTQNDLNQRVFGKWSPRQIAKGGRSS